MTGLARYGIAFFNSTFLSALREITISRPSFVFTMSFLRDSSSRALDTLLEGISVSSRNSPAKRISGLAISATSAACALGDNRSPSARTGRAEVATNPRKGRYACRPGTIKGTPCRTRAFRCLASISATTTTDKSVLRASCDGILFKSGRDSPPFTSATRNRTPPVTHCQYCAARERNTGRLAASFQGVAVKASPSSSSRYALKSFIPALFV